MNHQRHLIKPPNVGLRVAVGGAGDDPESWGFNVFRWVGARQPWVEPVVEMAMEVWRRQGLGPGLGIPDDKVKQVFQLIGGGYKCESTYHNVLHVLDVLMASHVLLSKGQMRRFFLPQEQLAILLAAFGHDCGRECARGRVGRGGGLTGKTDQTGG